MPTLGDFFSVLQLTSTGLSYFTKDALGGIILNEKVPKVDTTEKPPSFTTDLVVFLKNMKLRVKSQKYY